MADGNATGRAVFAIDVAASGLNAHAVRGIRAALGGYGMPSTWAVADLKSPAVEELRSDATTSEIALLADDAWYGPQVSRRDLHHALGARLEQAALIGLEVSSIAVGGDTSVRHLDLISKHGIRALRTADARQRAIRLTRATEAPSALRFGVWKMPTTADVVRDGARAARAAIRKAVRQRATVILVADAASVSPVALKRLVGTAARFVSEGRLQVQTLADAADVLARRRRMSPARSILRAA